MDMDRLREAIVKLGKRTSQYADVITGNPFQTRYALVDPLIRALDWDTADPEQVHLEPEAGSYQLRSGEVCCLEIRPTALSGTLERVEGFDSAFPYTALTDGRLWRIYESHFLARRDNQPALEFGLDDTLEAVIERASTLNRSNIAGAAAPLAFPSYSTAQPLDYALDYVNHMREHGTPEGRPLYLIATGTTEEGLPM